MSNVSLNTPIHLIAPSGAVLNKTSAINGANWLTSNGFKVENLSCIDRQFERFSGDDESRLKEIESIYNISNLDSIVMSVRGGFGASRLIPHIQWNKLASAINNGVRLLGHSDFTAIEIALFSRTQAISFAGPMLSYDFGIEDPNIPNISKFTFDCFKEVMINKSLNLTVKCNQSYCSTDLTILPNMNSLLWGGNLSMLVNLLGSHSFPSIDLIKNGTLFLEDVNEHPYRIERMLWQLLEAGILTSQKAILIGDFSAYKLSEIDHGYDLDTAINRINKEFKLRGADTVILTGLPFGHIRNKATLPIGVPISLTANQNGFNLKAKW